MSKKNAFSQAFSELISGPTSTPSTASETKSDPIEATTVSRADRAVEPSTVPTSSQPRRSGPMFSPGGKVTTIAMGTTVEGNMVVEGAAEIEGRLHGDIDCSGCLTVSGELVGRSRTAEIDVQGAWIEGNIESKGNVHVRDGSVIIGNVTGQAMQLFGAVKGDIILPGHVTVGPTAIIVGNIQAGSIDIQNGAAIDGYVAVKPNSQANSVFDQDKRKQ